ALHVPFAAYGFMGMLALGLAYILVPMFALSPAPDETQVRVSAALAALALLLAGAAAFGRGYAMPPQAAALAAGAGAAPRARPLVPARAHRVGADGREPGTGARHGARTRRADARDAVRHRPRSRLAAHARTGDDAAHRPVPRVDAQGAGNEAAAHALFAYRRSAAGDPLRVPPVRARPAGRSGDRRFVVARARPGRPRHVWRGGLPLVLRGPPPPPVP